MVQEQLLYKRSVLNLSFYAKVWPNLTNIDSHRRSLNGTAKQVEFVGLWVNF